MVRKTDCPDMTPAVYHGHLFKVSKKSNKQSCKQYTCHNIEKLCYFGTLLKKKLNGKPRMCHYQMSHIMRKPAFCICENKGADQLRSNCTADQHLCFRYIDSVIPIRNFQPLAIFCGCTVRFVSDLV